jgi:hypothetical protein
LFEEGEVAVIAPDEESVVAVAVSVTRHVRLRKKTTTTGQVIWIFDEHQGQGLPELADAGRVYGTAFLIVVTFTPRSFTSSAFTQPAYCLSDV